MVGIGGSLASIVGVVLAVYFYFAGNMERKLCIYAHPVKAVVVKGGQTSNLIVSFEGKKIESDVTAAQVAIWNRGKQSVESNDVLKPVILRTANGSSILEASIRSQSRDVVNLQLDKTRMEEGRLGISWHIMEKNDGGIIQLIYTGGVDNEIMGEGVLKGQGDIHIVKYHGKIKSPYEQIKISRKANRNIGIFLLLYGLMAMVLHIKLFPKSGEKINLRNVFMDVMIFTTPVLALVGGIYFLFFKRMIIPPFGF